MLADRVDVFENGLGALLRGRPDNPIAERGLKAEITRHGIRSRRGQHRADLKHQPVDVLMFVGSGLAAAAVAYGVSRLVMDGRRRFA
jgi:hypothetical protein